MSSAQARRDSGKRHAPKTNSGQGSKSAMEEMKRRAGSQPAPAPPAQSKTDPGNN